MSPNPAKKLKTAPQPNANNQAQPIPVILVGEDHRDAVHLQDVEQLVLKKAEQGPTILALEDDLEGEIVFSSDPNNRRPRPSKSTRSVANLKDPIENVQTSHQKGQDYRKMLTNIRTAIENNGPKYKDLYVVGVDTKGLEQKSDEDPERDAAMRDALRKASNYKPTSIVFPVGSAHIAYSADPKAINEKRLGYLLYKDPKFKVETENFYNNGPAFQEVQNDIQAYKNLIP